MNVLSKIFNFSGDRKRAEVEFESFNKAYTEATGLNFNWQDTKNHSIARIFGNSTILANKLIIEPSLAEEICSQDNCSCKTKETFFSELSQKISAIKECDSKTFKRVLREFKYREMIRIVAKELVSATIKESLAEWSDLADVLIEAAYKFAFLKLSKNLNPCHGAIIALGKLGGRELNLSSDVDLIFIYGADADEIAVSKAKNITNHEFHTKLAAETTKLLSSITPAGFVFRVDHELRPEGKGGPLANSLNAAIRYYECFGQDWERQALIRARPVAGNIALGEKFITELRPFIYRRSISISDLTHMRELKEKVLKRTQINSEASNIKHCAGGIREVEFLIQALLQLYGGTNPQIRKANTFDAIDALKEHSFIHPHAADILESAYNFLRKMENMLQSDLDLQIHNLPSDTVNLFKLARKMGFYAKNPAGAVEEMLMEFKKHTESVSRLFNALFDFDYDRLELEEALKNNISNSSSKEEEADSLAWFKNNESLRFARMDLEEKIDTKKLLKNLTLVAEVVIKNAFEAAFKRLMERYGNPILEDGSKASFAIIGMGKLGSSEIDYGSDLDLCFIYSGNGETDGEKRISNSEFFTKLAQRIISTFSLSTRYGKAYMIDSELRPSGQSGTLVTTIESFVNYHLTQAGIWEKLAMLKARIIAGDHEFVQQVEETLKMLVCGRKPPPVCDIRDEISRLRNRILNEKVSKTHGVLNIKSGTGGISELEAIIQFYHLCNINKYESLQIQNTFNLLDSLAKENVINESMYRLLSDHLYFYRQLMARLRLFSKSSVSAMDINAAYFGPLIKNMHFSSSSDFLTSLEKHSGSVGEIYQNEIMAK